MRHMGEALRKAASVIAAREVEDGFEVLVLERSADSRFLPGYVAFPGGAADDGDAALAELWFGSAEEAARACAVRELLEEVGLALTAKGLGSSDARGIQAVASAPPSAGQLSPIAHWIAPPDIPVRFDARYFAVEATDAVEPRPDGIEAARAWWSTPRSLLEDWREERRKLYWPTLFTMRAMAECDSVAELLDLRIATREPYEDELGRLPRSTFWQG
jgi:8-oxo-dGTP pyrophosphatase MutT (NUDIX family)